ncbi:hypothetical protein HAX54_032887 [Datura stramonium]|uniref:Glycosyltransferase N-terminal domain-containing protein n=1 Tax=Datura stramonium TaxID=4076 RepID=A0ABS8RLL7_DATST|nr:hypothetical protein [Datura stramonium]
MATNFDVIVVMVPLPEYGHQIPLLRLSQLISSYNIPVHYISIGTPSHQLKLRQQGTRFANMQFHDLPISRKKKDEDEDEEEEEDIMSYYESLLLLGEPLCVICRALLSSATNNNRKRLVIIHDAIMLPIVQSVYSVPNVEAYFFHAISAFTAYSWIQQVFSDSPADHNLFSPLKAHIPSVDNPGTTALIKIQQECKFKSGEIFNTCREIEGPYLDALSKQSDKPFWGLGPFNPVHIDGGGGGSDGCKRHRCIEWLDKQPLNSVILVSFGTASTFSPEQIHEIAIGLDRSEQKFIWVLREADKKGKSFTGVIPKIELPIGFEERVAERGIIAREWVPQLEILAHPSTGGYLFHSGWNSFLESATMGVPMATWPINADNPYNDVLITKVLKVGLVVRDWKHKDELVKSDTIEIAVRTLMNSPEGEEMRQRATELSKAIKTSVGDGGSTQKQMDSFIAHITR